MKLPLAAINDHHENIYLVGLLIIVGLAVFILRKIWTKGGEGGDKKE